MTPNVMITCAVTGASDTVGRHPAIPVTPEQIANAALEAAEAGASLTLARDEANRYHARKFRHWSPHSEAGAPLRPYSVDVDPQWIDYNGHMSEAYTRLHSAKRRMPCSATSA